MSILLNMNNLFLSFNDFLLKEENQCSIVTQKQLKDLEKFADNLLSKWGIDIEFSKHFGERVSDNRNDPCIKLSELQQLFKKINRDHGKKIKEQTDHEAVLKDIQSDLNLPFVVSIDNDKNLQITMKTIMRKKDFKSPDNFIEY